MKKKLFSLLLLAVVCCTTSLFAQQSSIKVDPVGEVDKVPVVVKKVGTYYILSSEVGKKVSYVPINLAKRFQKPATKLVISGIVGKVDTKTKSVGVPIKLTYSNLLTETTRNNPNQPKSEPKVEVEVAKEGDLVKGNVAVKGQKSKTLVKPTEEKTDKGPKQGVLTGGNKKIVKRPATTPKKANTNGKVNTSIKPKSSAKSSTTAPTTRGETIAGKKGIISKVGTEFIIKTKDGKHYAPGNSLELKYRKVGLQVIVSGEVGEIPPNVRMVGTPLKITSIKTVSGGRSKFKKKRRKK